LTFKHYIHKFSLIYLYIRTRKLVAEHWCATYRVTNKTFILKGPESSKSQAGTGIVE
jgi:hypothetical protein